MPRYNGRIGYITQSDGVFLSDTIEYRIYSGDILSLTGSVEQEENAVDSVKVTNRISVLADAWADKNYLSIVSAEYGGRMWEVVRTEVKRPRIILTLGGMYERHK